VETAELSHFQQKLRYEFKNEALLLEALRHSSYVNEQADPDMRDNERLEFLGDAVLDLVIGHLLMEAYPQAKEGDLSRMRSNLVNVDRLADLAAAIEMGPCILLGRGELQTNGREKKSILANTYEALIAAVYLDGGIEGVYGFVRTHFAALIETMDISEPDRDYKSRLQERMQETEKTTPQYWVVDASGPDHDKTFTVKVTAGPHQALGEGKSKKAAEQEAARALLDQLEKNA